jgi:hypothetical protein
LLVFLDAFKADGGNTGLGGLTVRDARLAALLTMRGEISFQATRPRFRKSKPLNLIQRSPPEAGVSKDEATASEGRPRH